MSTKQISMNTVRRYIKEIKRHMWYCVDTPSLVTTIQSYVLELKCFKKEVYKFCQNPEATFEEDAIRAEIDEKFLFYHFWDSKYKLAYENGVLYRFDSRGRFISAEEIVEESRGVVMIFFKKNVLRISSLIRQECLCKKPRSPKKVFKEIRQKNQII